MAVVKQLVGTRTALTGVSGTLASATYGVTSAYNCATNQPVDVAIEVALTPGTVSGNKQGVAFLQESLDGTNFRTGPTSGTTTTDEPDLLLLGVIPLGTNTTLQRVTFSVMQALGYVPNSFKVVIKNDSGAAFSAVAIQTAEISQTVI